MDCPSPCSSSGRITVRDLGDPRTKELVISSSDATGLGVDIARALLSFGLSVFFCDLTADNLWAYLVFHVRESDDSVDWGLLVEKLEATCPSDGDALAAMSHIAASEIEPFVVKVAGFDRPGLLWRISKAFWTLDCSVFKAHVSTDDDGNALDSFWIHDNTGGLPNPGRALEISDHLVELLGDNVDVSIAPAPSQTQVVPKNISAAFGSAFTFFEGERLRRLACKDATSHSNLKSLVIKNHVAQKHWSSSDSLSSSRSGSGSMDDLFMRGIPGTASGSVAGTGASLFNNNTCGDVTASSRHRRMSSILMDSPEKQIEGCCTHASGAEAHGTGQGIISTGLVENFQEGTANIGLSSLHTDVAGPSKMGLSPWSMVANNPTNRTTRFIPTVANGSCSSITREFDDLEHVSIEADTHTSSDYILLTIKCHNRKGILYDIFVQLKEIRVRVASCRTYILDDGRVCVNLMVQDAYGGDVCSAGDEKDSAEILMERMREAIAKSVTIFLGHGKREGQYRLMVVAMVDAGGRGRPRVTYDVTKLFASLGLSITECEVFVEEGFADEDESFEVHKYVFEPNMKCLRLTDGDMRMLTDAVVHSLQGREVESTSLPQFDYIKMKSVMDRETKARNITRNDTSLATDVQNQSVGIGALPTIRNATDGGHHSWLRLMN